MDDDGPVGNTSWMASRAPAILVQRGSQRFSTQTPWLDSRHSFSFGPHYDPANTGFGSLIVSNDDIVAAGTGFDTHPHRDAEIVTWVLSGSLVHQDSRGNNGVIYPGLAQRMSAGSGIRHSEKNDSYRLTGEPAHDTPVRFVQMWVLPDEPGIEPGYEQVDINEDLEAGGLVVVASGLPKHRNERAIRIHQRAAGLHVARMPGGAAIELPDAPMVHVFVAEGALSLPDGIDLTAGDSVRLTNAGGQSITAGADGAEALVWEMY